MVELVSWFVNVDIVDRHASLLKVVDENWGLVHVVPDTPHVVGTSEIFGGVKIWPECLSVFVQVINPYRCAWPAVSSENSLTIRLKNPDIRSIRSSLVACVFCVTIFINEVARGIRDMRVSDNYKATTSVSDLSVELHNFDLWESSFIKNEVMQVFSIFNIHP
jgi:hypothetical protein